MKAQLGTVRDFAEAHDLTARIERAISFAPSRLGSVWTIPVKYNFNLRTVAGRGGSIGVELHPRLARDDLRAERISTFLHELAHVMEWLEYRTGGHSQRWWQAMIRLGEEPWTSRYHSVGAELREFRVAARNGTQETDLTEEELGL